MKQMRFFTDNASTVETLRNTLIRKGLGETPARIECKDNSNHAYDALVLNAKQQGDEKKLHISMLLFVSYFLWSASMITLGALDFVSIALVVFIPFSFYYARFFFLLHQRSHAKSCDENTQPSKVYFLVLDVEPNCESRISRIAENIPVLIAA
ncbi:MAG: hypothetical protein K6L76_02170 [Agarilytica sp.]